MDRIRAIRLRMAAWFVASTGLVVFVLATVVFALLVHERSNELTRSLETAVNESIRAAGVIAGQQQNVVRVAIEAVGELNTHDMPLYLFDSNARDIGDQRPSLEVFDAARTALRKDIVRTHFQRNGQTWRLVAQAFLLRQQSFVIVAAADESELDLHYVRLIELFGLAALAGALLLGISSYYFAGRAIQPVVTNVEATRRFITDAAHELRTPVAALRTHAEVALQRSDIDDPTRHTLQTVVDESTRLSTLVADLLTLSRADTGERVIARKPFYLDDVVSDATASVSALARTRHITLSQGRYEQARINGDERLIRQLITILLDNALKYTPDGGAVTTHVYADGEAAVVAVADTGIGVPESERARIFDRFYRGERGRNSTAGAGLGLSIARWIVAAHDGQISVVPGDSGGSRFEARFPLVS